MDAEEKSRLVTQIGGQAIAEQDRRHTYCLIDQTSNTKIGTCIAIKLGERYFLASAAHVIQNADNLQVLIRDQVTLSISDSIARHYDTGLDLGLIEIPPSDSHCFEFLSQNVLGTTISDEQEIPVMVMGFPSQFCQPLKEIDLTTELTTRIIGCGTLTFNTVLLHKSEWPKEGLPDENGNYRPLIESRDILIDYHPKSEVKPFTPKTAGTNNPSVECLSLDPHGISGGGIWFSQMAQKPTGVQFPDARLIGLQLGWHREKNLLRGIRIEAWLDFVRENYPDLKNVI